MRKLALVFSVVGFFGLINENAFAFKLGDFLSENLGSYENCDSDGSIAQIKKLLPDVPLLRMKTQGAELKVFEIKNIKTNKAEEKKKFCSASAKTSHGVFPIDYDITDEGGQYWFQVNVGQEYLQKQIDENVKNFQEEFEKNMEVAEQKRKKEEEEKFAKELKKLRTNTVVDIEPTGKLYELFHFGSDNTDLQRKRMKDKISGKVVIWTLKVYDVSLETETIYKIQTSGDNTVGTFVFLSPQTDKERDFIEGLKVGSIITVKGIVNDIVMMHIQLKPAMLFDEKAEQERLAAEKAEQERLSELKSYIKKTYMKSTGAPTGQGLKTFKPVNRFKSTPKQTVPLLTDSSWKYFSYKDGTFLINKGVLSTPKGIDNDEYRSWGRWIVNVNDFITAYSYKLEVCTAGSCNETSEAYKTKHPILENIYKIEGCGFGKCLWFYTIRDIEKNSSEFKTDDEYGIANMLSSFILQKDGELYSPNHEVLKGSNETLSNSRDLWDVFKHKEKEYILIYQSFYEGDQFEIYRVNEDALLLVDSMNIAYAE
jgi:hypothetical protein